MLGVARDASLAQIKAAHRTLAKRYHPDSPTADPQRFLSVQEAYQLLSDPLGRREWDARHSPAPVRADQPAAAAPRPRGRRQPPPAPGREQPARNYTWSASEVPWWEEGGRRRHRAAGSAGAPSDGAGSPAEGQAPARGPRRATESGPPPAADQPRPDFDVYNRSSGAAWSSAARAYFRRADQDLPRRGSFRYQGSQPLTAARARAAAEDEARRRMATQASAEAATAPRRGRAPMPPPPAPEAGVAHDAERIHEVRARVRAEQQTANWPSRFQRLRHAALAWAPLALMVGYGGPVVADCQAVAADCPSVLVAGEALVAALLLGLLLAAPRIAYAGALATSVLVIGAVALLFGAWLVGATAPQLSALPPWAVTAGGLALVVSWLAVATWLLADKQRQPWSVIRVRR
ncbi:hypothetical protein BH23CHL7_BH23CHL7_17510 [soil metagenome]